MASKLSFTSSKGLVSLKQLSQTSFTARSAAASSGQAGLSFTERIARLRTHAYQTASSVGPNERQNESHEDNLVLFSECKESPSQLSRKFTVAAQTAGANLGRSWEKPVTYTYSRRSGATHFAACVVPQVVPVHLELAMIVHVHQLVHERVLHVFLAEKSSRAKDDGSSFGVEPSSTRVVARSTVDVVRRHLAARQLQMLDHEHHRGTWRHTKRYGQRR